MKFFSTPTTLCTLLVIIPIYIICKGFVFNYVEIFGIYLLFGEVFPSSLKFFCLNSILYFIQNSILLHLHNIRKNRKITTKCFHIRIYFSMSVYQLAKDKIESRTLNNNICLEILNIEKGLLGSASAGSSWSLCNIRPIVQYRLVVLGN